MAKGVNERIDEVVLRWFGHVERMENDRIAKRLYVGEFVGSRSVGRSRERRINTVKDWLKKRGLDVRQRRRMVQDGAGMAEVCEGEYMGHSPGMNLRI